MAASGLDAAQFAILRLLFLQRQARRAVRTRQAEAAVVLARSCIEALIIGLYCLHESDAVGQLQGENVRMLPLMLEFLSDADVIPADVLAECIKRLDLGAPGRAPTVEVMARRVDKATGGSIAAGLYKRFYRPTSNFAVHVGAGSLLRHVRGDGSLSQRPGRICLRRTPARIADACLGALIGAVAQRLGASFKHAARYADRHGERAMPPVLVMSSEGFKRSLRPRQFMTTVGLFRSHFNYVQSGTDADEPATRTARIRAAMETLLYTAEPDIPPGSLDPFLDYVAEKIVSETARTPG